MQDRDNGLSLIIETSIDIKSTIQSIDEKSSSMRTTAGRKKGSGLSDLINDLEIKINRMISQT